MTEPDRPTPSGSSVLRAGVLLVAAGAALFVCASALDPLAYRALRHPPSRHEDWYRVLRVAGYLPVWFAIGVALALHERARAPAEGLRRGAFVALSATAGGVFAELLKLVIRRRRPLEDGAYLFRPFTEAPFSTADLGLPSGHTLVAFAGALAMARLMPATAPLWLLWATGCAVSRLIDGGHFLSDTVLGAVAAVPVVWGVGRLLRVEPSR